MKKLPASERARILHLLCGIPLIVIELRAAAF
jgi:hypothetical protein